MSDFARLEDKLSKLRARERAPGEPRRLRGAGGAELLAALVTEIDETILPRQLTLEVEGGPTVQLAVANRRLQAMLAPAPGVDGAAALAGTALDDPEAPAVAALGEVLARCFEGAGAVEVSAARPGKTFPSDVGVPANVLARVWAVDEADGAAKSPAEVLDGFVARMGDAALAWLRIDGEEVSGQGGDAGRLAELGEQAAIFLDSYFGRFESLFPDEALSCATVIAPGDGGGAAALFIEYGEVSAFVAADPGKVAALASRWQSLVAE